MHKARLQPALCKLEPLSSCSADAPVTPTASATGAAQETAAVELEGCIRRRCDTEPLLSSDAASICQACYCADCQACCHLQSNLQQLPLQHSRTRPARPSSRTAGWTALQTLWGARNPSCRKRNGVSWTRRCACCAGGQDCKLATPTASSMHGSHLLRTPHLHGTT